MLLKKMFHFLGGVHFAIGLIASAAAMVVAGTLLESQTDSHLWAAKWTYGHPLFSLLLGLFFINILFAALRRWPFQKRHIPFLMTHLGLLMIIGGTLIKNQWGLQGHLSLIEGSESSHVLLPRTFALSIEKKGSTAPKELIALPLDPEGFSFSSSHTPLKGTVLKLAPHVTTTFETWAKGTKAYLLGLPPFPIHPWQPSSPLPAPMLCRLTPHATEAWHVRALETSHPQPLLHEAYAHELTLRLSSKENARSFIEIPLQEALKKHFSYDGGIFSLSLDLHSSPLNGTNIPLLHVNWESSFSHASEHYTIALRGEEALSLKSAAAPWLSPSFTIDLIRSSPTLYLIKNEAEQFIFAFDRHGRVHEEHFLPSQPTPFVAYDEGFKGYAVQMVLPFPPEAEQERMERMIVLEAPLTTHILPAPLPSKLEEQRPGLVLEVQEGTRRQLLTLSYDALAQGLKWPVLNGSYLIRFQPLYRELPYRLRLVKARQFFYPDSSQVYSYESDLLIKPHNQEPFSKTLSMNHVYEAPEGHRFYLSRVGKTANQELKEIELVVNHDPAKTFFTYPGAILLFLGSGLLFTLRKR